MADSLLVSEDLKAARATAVLPLLCDTIIPLALAEEIAG